MRAIQNGKDGRTGIFPEVGSVLVGWQRAMTFIKITNTTVNYENVKIETPYSFTGVFEPMSPRELFFKPEGQRNWKYFTLWTKNGLSIENGDIIIDSDNVRYKIIKSNDWSGAGYSQYELLQDYEKVGA